MRCHEEIFLGAPPVSHERKRSEFQGRDQVSFVHYSMACRVLSSCVSLRAIRPIQRISRSLPSSYRLASQTSTQPFTVNDIMAQNESQKVDQNGSQNGSKNDEHIPKDVPEKDRWKYRAPYRIHEKNESFDTKHEGECHCGKVKFQLSREAPLASKLCHCTTCQLQHAAPFQWAAIFHKEDINFTHGHHNLEWYDPTTKSIEHQLPCKVRCAFCHSPIMDEGRNMILLFPSLIHLKTQKAKDDFKPQ